MNTSTPYWEQDNFYRHYTIDEVVMLLEAIDDDQYGLSGCAGMFLHFLTMGMMITTFVDDKLDRSDFPCRTDSRH